MLRNQDLFTFVQDTEIFLVQITRNYCVDMWQLLELGGVVEYEYGPLKVRLTNTVRPHYTHLALYSTNNRPICL